MFRASVSYPYLSDLFVVERDNPDQLRLTLSERLEFCINAIIEMDNLHAKGTQPECLRLYELIIDFVKGHGMTIVIRPHSTTFKLPPQIARDRITENTGYSFDDLFITTTDTVPSEKSTVQLLGLLFFKLFQPLIYGEHLRTFPSLDKRSHDRLIEILTQMTHPDPDTRSTLANAYKSLKSLKSSHQHIYHAPSKKLIADIKNQQKLEAYFIAKNLDTRQLTDYDKLKIEVELEAIQFESRASTATISTPSQFTFFSTVITQAWQHNANHHSSAAAAAAQQADYDDDPTMDFYQNV